MHNYFTCPDKIKWTVFDPNEKLYDAGQSYLRSRKDKGKIDNLKFVEDLPEEPIDVIHMASSIEYVDDYMELLKSVSEKYRPEYIVLTRVKGGDIENYVTRQVVNGSSTPCHFLNISQLSASISELGYKEIVRAPDGGVIPEQFDGIPRNKTIHRTVVLIMKSI